jgi:hypothetical protein
MYTIFYASYIDDQILPKQSDQQSPQKGDRETLSLFEAIIDHFVLAEFDQ